MSMLTKENLISILGTFKTNVVALINAAKPTKVSELTNDAGYQTAEQLIAKATEVLNAAKDYTNTSIGGVVQFAIEKVAALPKVADAKANTIYLVPLAGSTETDNVYDEYLLIDGKFEHLGTTKVDLTGYYTSAQVDSAIAAATPVAMTQEEIDAINATLWP